MKCEVRGIDLDKDGFCPKCNRRYICLQENLNIMDGYRIAKINKLLYHSKNHNKYLEERTDYELNYLREEFVERYKKEDRLNNDYEETIKTLDGKVIYHCHEPLSDHINHGNAKKKEEDK